MTISAMNIRTFVSVAAALPADTSILLRGITGIGKSSVVRQLVDVIAKLENLPSMHFIDRRLSQMGEGDMIGLPSTDGHVTRFNPPDWIKRACDEPCVLFLDELNRATPEVMNAAFQLCLDREMNGHRLHPQTRIFSAINDGAEYSVNDMDPALLDRFWVIDFRPDLTDFVDHGKGAGKIAPVVLDFVQAYPKWLDPQKTTETGSKTTSRRSWARLSNALTRAGIVDEPTQPLFYGICIGYIGVEASIAFSDFAKTQNFQISGKDIVNNYSKVQEKVKALGGDKHNDLVAKVAEFVTKKLKDITPEQGANLCLFMNDLGSEHRFSCWGKLTSLGIDRLELARSIHKYCAASVLSVFGVPMGDKGINVIPNIPGVFKTTLAKTLIECCHTMI